MGTDMEGPAHSHGPMELCDPAIRLYEEALRNGRIARAGLAAAPCLTEMALLHPDPQDAEWMRPVPPSAALANLLQPFTRELDERVQLAAALSRSLVPLTTIASEDPALAITVIEGRPAIQASLVEATAIATEQVLTAHPGSNRPFNEMRQSSANARTAIGRGARLRHIYQHPARYSSNIRAYVDEIPADHLQVRTTEQTVERLIIFDRTVAYIPATPDRETALQIRHPALVAYLIQVYEVLWAQATPFSQPLPTAAPGARVTTVQQSIARLLVEGDVDDVIARKLGISVRTCRSHISKLMQTLGARSRTHLGANLVRSGIAGSGVAASEACTATAVPETSRGPASRM